MSKGNNDFTSQRILNVPKKKLFSSFSELDRYLGRKDYIRKRFQGKPGLYIKGELYVRVDANGEPSVNINTYKFKSLNMDCNGSYKKQFNKTSKGEKVEQNNLWDKLKSRYSKDELEILAKGEGLADKRLKYPVPHLEGKHYRIGVISDGHLGSKYSPVEWHKIAFDTFEKEGCSMILHCGDVVEGLKRARADTQIYELSHIGYKAQRDLAIEVFSQTKLPVYAISGNHDGFFNDSGANIVEDISKAVPNFTYLGEGTADMDFDGAIVRLHHGGDGNSYALSYRLQKIVESYSGGKKPNILFAGHVHKFVYIFERNIQAVSVPTLQMQTPWMQQKKLAAHAGFLICDFEVYNGNISNFQVKMYPFYE